MRGHTGDCCDALPLYRQEFILKRMGAEIPRSTMAEWMIKVSGLLLPIYEALNARWCFWKGLKASYSVMVIQRTKP